MELSRSRITFEEAMEKILSVLVLNTPMTVNQVAEHSGTRWTTTENVLNVIMDIQDFLIAYEVVVIEGRPRKSILAQCRVSMNKLPSEIVDWFSDSAFYTTPRKNYTTEEARKIIVAEEKIKKTPFHLAIRRVVMAIGLEDELSVYELSRRTSLNRRTVGRVLALLLKFQDRILEATIVKPDGSEYIRELRSSIYDMESERLKDILKKRYLA